MDVRFDDQTVNDNFNGMLIVFFQLDGFRKVIDHSIHAHPNKAASARGFEFLDMFPFTGTHHRSKHLNFCTFIHPENLIDNLIDGLLLDLPATDRAMRHANPRIEQPQIIIDFGDSAHC